MEPRIHFALTADGVRIAYATLGKGRPLVFMAPIPFRHVELEWRLPEDRRWLERLACGREVVRYDPRGLGLSQRAVASFDVDTLVLDLAAVVDAVSGGAVALFACVNSAPIAIAYAARHPERVSHLVLWCPVARMADSMPPQVVTLLGVAETDWTLFTEAAAHVMVGWAKGEAGHRYAEYLRACVTPEVMRPLIVGLRSGDVSELLCAVQAPTLVLHRRDVQSVPMALVSDLARKIPGARLQVLDGEHMRLGVDDVEVPARAVDEFLGDVGATARTLSAEPSHLPANTFRHEGDYWTLAFDGRVSRVRNVKGLHHIARLLRDPGLDVPAVALVSDVDAAPPHASSLGDAGSLLDQQAKSTYKRRLAELREEIDEAERANDPAAAERARAELEFIAHEVSAAVGIGGRDRKASSAVERARLAVTKRIKDAIARIRAVHPPLAAHLAQTIKTGHLCAYRDGPQSIAWTF
jgi:pimeloyl-ACP methyl ester carboxylesterase